MKKFILYLFTLTIVWTSNAQSYDLSFTLKKGDIYNQNTSVNMDMNTNMMGQSMKINLGMVMNMQFMVKEVKDTVYDFEVTISKITMNISAPTGANDKVGDIFNKMTGKKFNMKMSNKGKVLEIQNISQVFDAIFDESSNMSAEEKQKAKEQIAGVLNEKSFISNIESASAIFPTSAIKIGEKWNVKTLMQNNFSGIIDTEYVLKSVNKDYYVISGTSKIYTDPNNSTMNMGGLNMSLNLSGNDIAELKVSRKTGWLINTTRTQSMKILLKMDGNDQMPDGLTMNMDLNTKIVVTDN